MGKGIKGITVEIDGNVTPLNKALTGVNKNTKELQSELKGINSLLKLDPSNTDLLRQKQVVLKSAISETESKLKTLTEAQKQMVAAGKDVNDPAYRDLQREIVLTTSKLNDLKSQVTTFEKLKVATGTFGDKIAAIAQKIPVVNKLGTAFTEVKNKVKEAADGSEKIQKVKTAVEGVKEKVSSTADKIPIIGKLGSAFESVKNKVGEVSGKLPTLTQMLKKVGEEGTKLAQGGFQVVTTAVGGTAKAFAAFSTAAIGSATAIAGLAVQQASSLDTIDKMSQSLGMSREGYQKWSYVLGQNGADIDSFGTGMKKMVSTMQTASEGNKSAQSTFKKLGVSINNTDGSLRNQEETLTDVVKAFQGMEEGTEKSALATEVFGKQGQALLPLLNQQSGSVEELMKQCEDLGMVMSDETVDAAVVFGDTLDALKQSAQGLFNTFVSTGILTTFTGAMNTAMGAIKDLLQAYKNDGISGLIDQMNITISDLLGTAIEKISAAAPDLIATASSLLTAIITTIATNLPVLINGLLPTLLTAFFGLISAIINTFPTLLPQLLLAAVTFFGGIMDGLNQIIPQLMEMLPVIITNLCTVITENLPFIVASGVEILVNLINGIANAIPQLMTQIIALIPVIVQCVVDNLPAIIDAGMNILSAIISGIIQAIPQLIAALPQMISAILNTITQNLPKILDQGIVILQNIINGIIQAIPALVEALPKVITSIIQFIIDNLPQIIESGIKLIGALIEGLIKAIPEIIKALPQIISSIIETFKNTDWLEVGKNIIKGIASGIVSAAGSIVEAAVDAAKDAVNAVKGWLGIKSPSRKMRDEVGKQMAAGLGLGFVDEMESQEQDMQDSIPTTFDSYITAQKRSADKIQYAGYGGYVQNITINSPQALSPAETARQTRNATRQMVLQLKRA
ncbi:hypothetical protein [Diplocloster modestus]|uniref:Uncharacterized protein n=1 Tax=Diplocloster modestus TaxID=2850322 RepID=A0ABS6KCM8_9FIRM|nr:hypothetical protein [Diplocloster modestus]MBU9728267.1 hypothetical protein [Diplocloster modestus]